ncbi:MAG: NAD(P)H-quinone oxidoreductase [Gemmatimonadaceae bacterium]
MAERMRAVVITRPGPADVLEIREVPRPEPVGTEVLVRVRSAALNRADLLQRAGRYPAPAGSPSDIPGIEFAGEVVAMGPVARRWTAGDRVYGIVGGGAHAEYLVTDERTVTAVPDALSLADAGAVPEAFATAHDALVTQATLSAGERMLIHAVGSGVGLAAVQLARAVGAVPYGTARTADKIERARRLGLEDGIPVTGDMGPLAARVLEWTDGKGMDVVLDLVGGAYVAASVGALGRLGRLMCLATLGGRDAALDVGRVLALRLTVRGSVLRSRSLAEKIVVTEAFAAAVSPLLADGRIVPTIDSRFPLADVARAHERLEGNTTFGKVVLDVTG